MNSSIPTRFGIQGDEPFAGDALDRAAIADRLSKYLERLHFGCVIGIDAPWGEGKTWFGKNWSKQLIAFGYTVIWLDTFETDHNDDPFLTITAEIYAALEKKKDSAAKLLSKAKEAGLVLLPLAAKATISLASRAVFGMDMAEEYQEKQKASTSGAEKAAESWIEKRIRDHQAHKKTIDSFRNTLAEVASDLDKPLVIFIDELDRCRPDYAVRFIERTKHFFDTNGVVFILLLHRSQLQQAIHGVYGAGVDADQYLAKFVHFFLRLPKLDRKDFSQKNYILEFCKKLSEFHGFTQDSTTKNFNEEFSTFARFSDLSLREIEKGYILASLGQSWGGATCIDAWLILLKLRYPQIFIGILADNRDAHHQANNVLQGFRNEFQDCVFLTWLMELHNTSNEPNQVQQATLHSLQINRLSYPGKYLKKRAGKIDLTITT